MATLQTIRSKGPLLVVVIGLALFAFIAGDAWKVLQPHQGKQDVGEVNGKTLTAQEYQKMVDEYTEVIKLTQGVSALNDDQLKIPSGLRSSGRKQNACTICRILSKDGSFLEFY